MNKSLDYFFIEITDTYAGEANYSWVTRYKVKAVSMRGALVKLSKYRGYQGQLKKVLDCGDLLRYDLRGAGVCVFIQYFDEMQAHNLINLKEI